jgi:hypothetical protein
MRVIDCTAMAAVLHRPVITIAFGKEKKAAGGACLPRWR